MGQRPGGPWRSAINVRLCSGVLFSHSFLLPPHSSPRRHPHPPCATDDVWKKYTKAPLDGSPQVAAVCPARLMRGGAWDDNPRMLRSAQRYYGTAAERNYAFGFRVARDLER